MKKMYTLYDTVAQVIGPIVLHGADAPAVRMFGDVASDTSGQVGKHIADFQLLCLGDVHDDGRIESVGPRVVITGQAWLDAQTPVEAN